jgi:hypothetical protein
MQNPRLITADFATRKEERKKMKKMKIGSKFIYCPVCLAAGLTLS